MEELGKVITELIRAGKEVGQMALIGYFTFRILEVLAWPCVWITAAWAIGRYGLGRFFDMWKIRAQASLARAKAEWAQQLLSAELYIERQQKADPNFKPPAWYSECTTYWPGSSNFST